MPNAILTFKEYLLDYASLETRVVGENLIGKELQALPSDTIREKVNGMLKRIEAGERDLYV